LTDATSNWSFDPKQGPILKDAKLSDTGKYHCVGSMNNVKEENEFHLIVLGFDSNSFKLNSLTETPAKNRSRTGEGWRS
jgi:hypothetical protein